MSYKKYGWFKKSTVVWKIRLVQNIESHFIAVMDNKFTHFKRNPTLIKIYFKEQQKLENSQKTQLVPG